MPDLPETRQSLLVRLRDRSDDAWAEFLGIYEKSIVDYAKRKGLQEADALDVTQEVLAALESKLPTWKMNPVHGKFRGWLFRVARNVAVDKIIERAKNPQAVEACSLTQLSQLPGQTSDESDEFLQRYRRQLLHWAAERIRPRVSKITWQAFWKTAMEGMPADDVAIQLGLTKGNVYAAKFRVTSRIQKLVEGFDTADDAGWNNEEAM